MNKDTFWGNLEDEVILVKKFSPLAEVKNSKVFSKRLNIPYAYVTVNSPKLDPEAILPINHKKDFVHLWEAFKIRTISDSKELLIHFSRKHHSGLLKLFYRFLPHLRVMICPSGAYSKIINPNWWKQTPGREAFLSIRPIQEWDAI